MKRLRFRSKSDSSRLEAKFALYWRALGGPPLVPEFRFNPQRRWRADFAHIESRTLIEIEGGLHIFGGGRHNRPAGFIAAAEKYLELFLRDGRSCASPRSRLQRQTSNGSYAECVSTQTAPDWVGSRALLPCGFERRKELRNAAFIRLCGAQTTLLRAGVAVKKV